MSRTQWWFLALAGFGLGLYAVSRARTAERIPGGLSAGMSPGDFDPRALRAGIATELEHTSSRAVAREIAMDHLVEDPDYYVKLKEAGL
jgi:hypothetical protein